VQPGVKSLDCHPNQHWVSVTNQHWSAKRATPSSPAPAASAVVATCERSQKNFAWSCLRDGIGSTMTSVTDVSRLASMWTFNGESRYECQLPWTRAHKHTLDLGISLSTVLGCLAAEVEL